MDGDLATTYTLIHAFLMKRSHVKAAQALKNSVKKRLVLKDHVELEGPSLEDIIRLWKARRDEDQEDSDSSSSSSSSSSRSSAIIKRARLKRKDETSDPSSSSESSSESESETYIQKSKIPDKKSTKVDSSSSSDDDSSDSESPMKSTTPKCENTSSGTLSSNDSSESDETSKKTHSKQTLISKEKHSKATVGQVSHKVNAAKKINRKHDKSDSSSDSDSSAQPKLITKRFSSSSSSSSSEDSDSEPLPKLKSKANDAVKVSTANSNSKGEPALTSSVQDPKAQMNVEGNAVVTASAIIDTISTPKVRGRSQITGKTGNDPRTINNRFARVNSSKTQPAVDNSYISKNAPTNDYGKRAHQDLIVTRGAGFRKEKNKKKRGSYRGGEITMESHSFKFT